MHLVLYQTWKLKFVPVTSEEDAKRAENAGVKLLFFLFRTVSSDSKYLDKYVRNSPIVLQSPPNIFQICGKRFIWRRNVPSLA